MAAEEQDTPQADEPQAQGDQPSQPIIDDSDVRAADRPVAPPDDKGDEQPVEQTEQADSTGQEQADAPSDQTRETEQADPAEPQDAEPVAEEAAAPAEEPNGAANETSAEQPADQTATDDAAQVEPAASTDEAARQPGESPAPAEPTQQIPATVSKLAEIVGKLSPVNLLLVLNSVLILFAVGGLFYLLLSKPSQPMTPRGARAATTALQQTSPDGPTVRHSGDDNATLSWADAEGLYEQGDYESALAGFVNLARQIRSVPSEDLLRDLFDLRVAQCLGQLGEGDEASLTFLRLASSGSAIIAAVADYEQASIDLTAGRHAQGRIRAYSAVAHLASLEAPCPLQRDCDYLVARILTQQVLGYLNADSAVTWRDPAPYDPFAGKAPAQLRQMLRQGAAPPAKAALGAMVWKVEAGPAEGRWIAACIRAPVEDLLQRFSSESGVAVEWVSTAPLVRRRAISLHLEGVSQQRLAEVACGMAGLVARFTGESIAVHDPQACDSLAQQRELLMAEAESCWRRFFIRYPADQRTATGHFVVAVMHDASGDKANALTQYQYVAAQFDKHPVAPLALLQAAKLRISLRDYSGARTDLLALMDRYPEAGRSEEVYLRLGQATAETGLTDEAIRIFKRLYYLDLSAASKRQAAFYLGQCHYRSGRYKEAVAWLSRYAETADAKTDDNAAAAQLMLGDSAMTAGDLKLAEKAFAAANNCQPTPYQRAEALLGAAEAGARGQKPLETLAALKLLEGRPLTDRQTYKRLTFTAGAYASMGLEDRAVSYLRNRIQLIGDLQTRALLVMELARYYVEQGQLDSAHAALTEILAKIEPGREASLAACELADVCIKMGKADQAVAVLAETLKGPCDKGLRNRAMETLALARVYQKQYRAAADAFTEVAIHRAAADDKPQEGQGK